MSTQRILIADDDDHIREILKLYFSKEGFSVEEASNGVETLRKADHFQPNLILLDIMMPILDGIETCREIRKFSLVPIIMLSARAEDEDRILGLELGADDYIAKPFNPREIVARVNAVLRRTPNAEFAQAQQLSFPGLSINIDAYTVTTSSAIIPVTTKEMELLWCLASHPGRTFTREVLLEKIWGYTYCGETRTVDNHIRRLRQKLGATEKTPWDIKTVWGIGYRFEVRS